MQQKQVGQAGRAGWWWLGAVVCLFIVLALVFLYRSQPGPVQHEVVRAQRGTIERVVEARGNVQLRSWADASARISGQVIKLPVSVGDYVRAGKVVAEIAPSTEQDMQASRKAELARLQAELAGAKARYEFAELQFRRQSQLKAENATREEAFESSRMNMQSAAAHVDAIRAQVHQLESKMLEDLQYAQRGIVTAPLSGTVVALHVRQGQPVQSGRDVLMRIASLDRMNVLVQVSEEDVTRLKPGMPAYFTTPGYPGKTWKGQLRQRMPLPVPDTAAVGKTAYYHVLFDVDNPDGQLLAGMTADVRFVLDSANDAVTVPVSVVVRPDEQGEQALRILQEDGTIATRRVRIGIRNATRAQVLSGLAEGEQVIVSQ